MRTCLILLTVLVSAAFAGQYEWINFYTGGLADSTFYLWTWGWAEEPKSVEGAGYTPGTAAVEAKWVKNATPDPAWLTYGVYFGDRGFDMYDIVPDSVYFKLKAPDGVGTSDRLKIWLYDPRNSNWDNAIYYDLTDLQILQDKQWHQFSVSLWDFKVNIAEPDYTNIIALSIERPIADDNSEFPLMYIDHVWIGLPDFVAVKEEPETTIKTCSLEQNYPNPFNPITTITFELSTSRTITLSIYNLAGERVAEWETDSLPAGRYRYQWNAEGFPSGAYFCRMKSGEFSQTRKMLLVR